MNRDGSGTTHDALRTDHDRMRTNHEALWTNHDGVGTIHDGLGQTHDGVGPGAIGKVPKKSCQRRAARNKVLAGLGTPNIGSTSENTGHQERKNMEKTSAHLLDAFTRVDAYHTIYAASFPAGSLGETQFAKVKAAIPQTGTLSGTQSAGSAAEHDAALHKAYDRVLIHRDLSAINHAAHSLALMGVAGTAGAFKMTHQTGDQALLASARGFVTNATPLTASFVQVGLPADFLTTLGTHIAQLEADNAAKGSSQGRPPAPPVASPRPCMMRASPCTSSIPWCAIPFATTRRR